MQKSFLGITAENSPLYRCYTVTIRTEISYWQRYMQFPVIQLNQNDYTETDELKQSWSQWKLRLLIPVITGHNSQYTAHPLGVYITSDLKARWAVGTFDHSSPMEWM